MRTWQRLQTAALGRHAHRRAYAALVLSGSYEEAGDSGRHRVGPGDIILHDCFEAHLDRIPLSGAVVLNLPLPQLCVRPGLARSVESDVIVQTAEKSRSEAAALLLATVQSKSTQFLDWPDQLAADLAEDASVQLIPWAEANSVSAWELSRGFAQVFGISPRAFRARARARQAWRTIIHSDATLATIAADLEFADQSHMTRSVRELTGRTPQAWQRCK